MRSSSPSWLNSPQMWEMRPNQFWWVYSSHLFYIDPTWYCLCACFWSVGHPDHVDQLGLRASICYIQSSGFILAVSRRRESFNKRRNQTCCCELSSNCIPLSIAPCYWSFTSNLVQQAAGTLSFLQTSVLPKLVPSPDNEEICLDFSDAFVKSLEWLMLAQAQECSWQLAKLSAFPSHSLNIGRR